MKRYFLFGVASFLVVIPFIEDVPVSAALLCFAIFGVVVGLLRASAIEDFSIAEVTFSGVGFATLLSVLLWISDST